MEDMLPFNGLRGVCALAIFLGHQTDMFLSSPWRGQTVVVGLEYLQAVSLFFFLSGIPLARLYSTTGKVHTLAGAKNFWRKRLARLAPMYYLTLCLNLIVVLVICETVDLKTTLASFFGCVFLLQSWFVSFINVGGVLWQVAIFAYGYALFPFLSRRISSWSSNLLWGGIVILWLFSTGLWCAVFAQPAEMREWKWWIWHVHCVSRLPHYGVGVLLGELVERMRDDSGRNHACWANITDILSLVLLVTAIQAPILEVYYGTSIRNEVSIGLQALLLPLHVLWLVGMVLAYSPVSATDSNSRESGLDNGCRKCWTRLVLSRKPLTAVGDVSLVLYCLHLVVLFFYTSVLAFVTTDNWRIAPTVDSYTLRVKATCWHAPIQWVLVLAVSFATSRWVEAPLRRILTGSTGRQATVAIQGTGQGEEEVMLIPPSSNVTSYGGADM